MRLTQEYDLFLASVPIYPRFSSYQCDRGLERPVQSQRVLDRRVLGCRDSAMRTLDSRAEEVRLRICGLSRNRREPYRRLSASLAVGLGALWTRFDSALIRTPSRIIDVYSIGAGVRAFIENCPEPRAKGSLFYLHDTFGGSLSDVHDYREHRNVYSPTSTKRIKIFPGALRENRTSRMKLAGKRKSAIATMKEQRLAPS